MNQNYLFFYFIITLCKHLLRVKHILIHKMLLRTLISICALIGWVGARKVGWILYWGYYYGFSNCVGLMHNRYLRY